jgi:hypothetical protein
VAQVISNGNVIEQSTLNLTANQPQDVAFTANSYTPNTVRVLYQGVQVSSSRPGRNPASMVSPPPWRRAVSVSAPSGRC